MTTRTDAQALGYHLWNHGFRPLPDIGGHGQLLGVRMWRQQVVSWELSRSA